MTLINKYISKTQTLFRLILQTFPIGISYLFTERFLLQFERYAVS